MGVMGEETDVEVDLLVEIRASWLGYGRQERA
jgi:hypothetical protein